MAAKDFRICPSCGGRNKARWEFCVRCGESLQDVALGEPEGSAEAEAEVSPEAAAGTPWGLIGLTVLLVGAGGFAAYRFRPGPPVAPDSSLFSFGTQPPETPATMRSIQTTSGRDAFEKGRQLLLQGKAAEALPFLADAVAAEPEDASYHDTYGSALWATDAKDAALNEYGAAVRLAPGIVSYRLDRAKALAMTGQSDEAVADYQAALAVDPSDADVLQNFARLRTKRGEAAEAATLLRTAAERRPDDLVLQQDLAYALEKSGNLTGAAEVYGRIVDILPEAQIARGRLAEALFKAGKGEEALGVFRSGLEAHPQDPLLHRGLASMLERTGKVQEAIAEYREYAKLAPNSKDAAQLADRAARLEKKLASPPNS